MSAEEILREREFRIAERIALLCETRDPTPGELSLATQEADAWVAAWYSQASSSICRNNRSRAHAPALTDCSGILTMTPSPSNSTSASISSSMSEQ